MDRTPAAIDLAYEKVGSILDSLKGVDLTSPTESDTRLQLIDRVLTEVLSWPHTSIQTEQSDDAGRVDYILSAGSEKMIVEAKRTGVRFDLKTAGAFRTSYKVSSPILRSGATGEAMAQVEEYARRRGIALACATNGFQWIVFLASRTDGIPPDEGQAFVFLSADDLRDPDRFRLFHELLSRESVRSQFYRQHFLRLEGRLKDASVRTAQRYLDEVAGPDRQRKLSEIAKALDPVIEELLTNISPENRPKILRDCFVSSRESDDADSRLKRIVQELTEDIETIDTRDENDDQLNTIVTETMAAAVARTVLLIGQIGAGKSTYLNRFFEDILPAPLKRHVVLVQIDLVHGRMGEAGFSGYLRTQTLTELRRAVFQKKAPTFEQLQGAFFSFYNQLKEGELKFLYQQEPAKFKARFGEWLLQLQKNDPERYLRELLAHAHKSRKKLVCVVFDNIDHFSDATQEVAFGHAQWLTGLGRVLAIVPVRDTTYWRSKSEGIFHASAHTALYLPRPPLDKVLGRRFAYAQKQLETIDTGKKTDVTISSLRGLRVKIEKPSELFRLLTEVFSAEVYPNDILRGLSGGDVREALRIFRQIVTSPWMSLDTLLAAYLAKGDYHLRALDETKIDRAAILGQWEHFSQERSPRILNLLWTPRTTDTSPLLALRILERVYEFRDVEDPRAGRGFESVERIGTYFGLCGVPVSASDMALVELVNARLLDPFDISILSGNRQLVSAEELRFVTITPAGRLHRRWVQQRRSYALSMVEDMGVVDDAVFDEICRGEQHRGEALRQKDFGAAEDIEADLCGLVKAYLLSQDAACLNIPAGGEFAAQRNATESLFQWLLAANKGRGRRGAA